MSETEEVISPELAAQCRSDLIREVGFFAAVLACFLPLLYVHFDLLWAYEHYQYFPLLMLAIPYLIWNIRYPEVIPLRRRHLVSWIVLAIGWSVLAFALLAWSPNLAALAFAITSGAAIIYFFQSGRITRLFSLWLVFLFLVKLPVNMDVDLIFWLQGFTSKLASGMLDLADINHVLAGHTIKIPDKSFLVEDACSGIQSLFALLAATAIILVLVQRGWFHSLLLFLAAVFWACLINAVRVAAIVISHESFDIDLSTGWPHETLGLALFAFAVWMLYSTDSFFYFLFVADQSVDLGTMKASDGWMSRLLLGNPPEVSTEPFQFEKGHYLALGMFALLGVGQIVSLVLTNRSTAAVDVDDPRLNGVFTAETLPKSIGAWKRSGFEIQSRSRTNYLGRHSAVWTYESEVGKAAVSVDYPFLGWHELTGCYKAQGCILEKRSVVQAGSNKQSAYDIRPIAAEVRTPEGKRGYLWFSEFRDSGEPLYPIELSAGKIAYWMSRLESSFLRQTTRLRSNPGNYQSQVYITPNRPLNEEDEASLLKLHIDTSATAIDIIVNALKSE